jgi:hypothetical protein
VFENRVHSPHFSPTVQAKFSASPDAAAVSEREAKGGQRTNSPPPNVSFPSFEPFKVLASGFDTVALAIDVEWQNDDFFQILDKLQLRAQQKETEAPAEVASAAPEQFNYNVLAHGSNGYAWILQGREYTLKIGNWKTPRSRPSVMVDIRSETLWRLGVKAAVDHIQNVLQKAGAKVLTAKASRVDLCVDMLIPEELWNDNLRLHLVSRAAKRDPHFSHDDFTGLSLGSGKISARLYDKPLEIDVKSKKYWMYDIWGIADVPVGSKIIRHEFQLRREFLKELNLNLIPEAMREAHRVWSYCTKQWLQFVDNPKIHHTQQKTMPWWLVVQNGFKGVQNAEPLVRVKACSADEIGIAQQVLGYLSSLTACMVRDGKLADVEKFTLEDCMREIPRLAKLICMTPKKFAAEGRRKLAKYRMSDAKKRGKS